MRKDVSVESKIKVYGAPWCPDCRHAKQFLGEQRVPYQWIDVDEDQEGMRYIEQVNNGKHIIPTILFEDGSTRVEPSNAEIAQKLGLRMKASRGSTTWLLSARRERPRRSKTIPASLNPLPVMSWPGGGRSRPLALA